MPQFQVTTKTAEQVWSSPDGKLTIFKLLLDYQGQDMQAKTYSKTVATEGWTGTVETYEKAGRNGSETFVKQPQKEGGWQGGSSGGGRSFGGVKAPQDNYTMYLSYAKDIGIACIKDGKFDSDLFSQVLEAVEAGGAQLFASRDNAKPEVNVDIENIEKVFNDDKEEPWTKENQPPQLPV